MSFYTPSSRRTLVKSKVIATLLFIAVMFSIVLPVTAETTDVSGSATESTTQTIDIYVTKAASFSVKLPVSITLEQENGTGTADYSIYVKGDVEDGSSVTVGPQADTISFQKTKGNTSTTLTGSVTQAKNSVAAADINTDYPAAGQLGGSIQVSGITAGQWKGQMTFAVGYTGGSSDTPLNATAEMDKAAVQAAAKEAPVITFARKAAAPSGTVSSIDVSVAKDGSVMAHTLSDGSVVIGADGGVLAPEDMTRAFDRYKAANIDCSGLDTRNVTNMSYMFYNCSNLTALDVSNFNTKNVRNASYMFSSCSGLTSLDISNFDTQNATNMYGMFNNCSGLSSLNLSNFNTNSATNIGNMFHNCKNLTFLDLSNFNTQNVTSMVYMFQGCSNLTALNINGFSISKVSNSDNMFDGSSNVTIYVSDANIEAWVKSTTDFPTTATVIIGTPE